MPSTVISPGVGRLAIEQAHQTRLAGTGMADEKNEATLGDFEVDAVEGAHSVRIHERDAA